MTLPYQIFTRRGSEREREEHGARLRRVVGRKRRRMNEKNLKNLGGRRGVVNPVCPPERPQSGRRSLWANVGLSMPLSRWGRVSPHEPEGFAFEPKKIEPATAATVLALVITERATTWNHCL
jgi:hypothetical protein